MKITNARGPLRIGFAGGGSDVDPFCSKYGGRVLNATISKYVYARIIDSNDGTQFISLDRALNSNYLDPVSPEEDPLPLHRNAFKYFCQTYLDGNYPEVCIETYTEAPVGSGLGTSSTLVVTVIKGLAKHFDIALTNYEIAHAAQVVEREMCKFAGGRQDQFSATFGGFNYMEFEADSNVINQLRIPRESILALESNLVLYHMGTSRLSSKIIEDQARTVRADGDDAWSAMMEIRDEAKAMKNFLLKRDMNGVINSLKRGWENKKRTSKSVSSSQIDQIYESAIAAGALAGRVSGAGGGGFMLFYVPVQKRSSVLCVLSGYGGFVSNVEFVEQGVEAWNE